jgi:hypothetical protein
MRFIIMHKTNAYWESGGLPTKELIARVGQMLQQLIKEGRLLGGDGLRPSAQGVRLTFEAGSTRVQPGPFAAGNELPAAFSVVRSTLAEAIEWATHRAAVAGDTEIDIRPMTEPWDLGMQPAPSDPAIRRYMVLSKATPESEAGASPTAAQRASLAELVAETAASGMHLQSEVMRPSARGRRYLNARDGISVMDGPFAETKELLGGFVIVAADSLDQVHPWALDYLRTVDATEVDVRELEN